MLVFSYIQVYVWGQSKYGIIPEPSITSLDNIDQVFVVYLNSRTFRLLNASMQLKLYLFTPHIDTIILAVFKE